MSVLCVIPARYASQRLPGKPLVDLGGKTLITRVCESVTAADCFDKIVVATDDERIYDHVTSGGFGAEMTSQDHESGTSRCAEVAERHTEFNYVVNVQGDEPNVEAELLQAIVEELKFGDHEGIVTAVSPMNAQEAQNPDRVKVVLNWARYALTFSRSVIPYQRHNTPDLEYLRHIGIYGFRIGLLPKLTEYPPCDLEMIEGLEQLRWIYYGHQLKCLPGNWKSTGIDSPEDVEEFMKNL
ncbi:MAG: 3-deoxy-manno-octulosonate cytidylyltransferase [Saprospiraceae bacterium]|nr:3-deoxy-manno-octulosonate cytidylyltransferase [Saprospiraceae bacterium]